jgi:pimeloyl-ACP methyl ester carboxylesterase
MPSLALPRLPTPGVPRIDPPRVEGVIPLGDGHRAGFAEYGDPTGPLVLWFHGTPGARRQIPPVGREEADRLGIRLVCVERPAVGDTTDLRLGSFADWAGVTATVADHLGYERFSVVGLSGGGPYALAAAAGLPERVESVGILGGVCPVAGPDACPGGVVGLAARFQTLLEPLRKPFGVFVWLLLQPIAPLAHPSYRAFAKYMPEGDREVFRDPGIEAMFIDDLLHASRRQFGALAHDVALFGRPWGFELADVRAPVRWWHGDADNFVPLAHAEATAAKLPDCELYVRPGESHLGGFAAADLVLRTVQSLRVG